MRTTTMMRVVPGVAAVLAATFAWGAPPPNPARYAASAAAEARPSPPEKRLERRFLQLTAANLRFQSEASRLAMARSNNPAVKDVANTMLARQQTVQPELLRLLHVRGMAMPIPSNEHNTLLKQLGKLNGAKFDRLYVDEVVLRSYHDDISNYEKVAADAEDPVLKAWVERQLPTLRFHYAKAGRALPSAGLRGQRAV
jgi:putative membrane protein